MLHSARYPDCHVEGLLVGTSDGFIQEVVPLSHQSALTPLLEVASMLTQTWMEAQKKDLLVLGYYCSTVCVLNIFSFLI